MLKFISVQINLWGTIPLKDMMVYTPQPLLKLSWKIYVMRKLQQRNQWEIIPLTREIYHYYTDVVTNAKAPDVALTQHILSLNHESNHALLRPIIPVGGGDMVVT